MGANSVGELRESPVLAGDEERGLVRGRWWGAGVDLTKGTNEEPAAVVFAGENARPAEVNRSHTHAARVGAEIRTAVCLRMGQG
jgi:hypothetical protein